MVNYLVFQSLESKSYGSTLIRMFSLILSHIKRVPERANSKIIQFE
jgi:hypothetical protein